MPECDVRVECENVAVSLEYIGEGYCGEYDPDDPADIPLLRFYVEKRRVEEPEVFGEWEDIEDASYCTNINANILDERAKELAQMILDEVYDAVLAGQSIKKLCERLSWLDDGSTGLPDWPGNYH